MPIVQLVKKDADLQIQTFSAFAGEEDLQIIMPDGFPIFVQSVQDFEQSIFFRAIKRHLLKYAQISFLRKLDIANDELKVKVEFFDC